MNKKKLISLLTAAAVVTVSSVYSFGAESISYGSGEAGRDGAAEAAAVHHPAYISGYPDGTVKPEKKLKRAEAVRMLHNADSRNEDTAEEFSSSPLITRGEFAQLVLDAYGTEVSGISDFMQGYPDGTLGLERMLTRAEAVTVINRAMGRTADSFTVNVSGNLRIMPDVTDEHWAYMQLMEAVTDHSTSGTCEAEDGTIEEFWSEWKPGTVQLPEGWRNIDGNLFYVNSQKLFSYKTSVDGISLDRNGRYSTGNAELDALLRAEIKKIINNDMTQPEKLRAIYDYMIENYGYRAAGTVEAGASGWEEDFAVKMLQSGKGNCYSWAAVFTYLARQSGWAAEAVSGTAVSPKGSVREHAWSEIESDGVLYTFDPEIEGVYAQTAGETYDLFMKKYGEAVWTYVKPEPEPEEPAGEEDGTGIVSEKLAAILDSIYEGAGIQIALADTAVNPSNEKYFTGVEGLRYTAGVAREPMMTSVAHSAVLLEMEEGADMDAAAEAVKQNADGMKWICVGVSDENILTGYSGRYLLLVMDNNKSGQLMDAFKKLELK